MFNIDFYNYISSAVSIDKAYYNYIENGKRRPSVPVAKRIGAVLGFDWTRFYEDPTEGGHP